MDEAARVILTKLTLVDPTTSKFSAYQQSAEIRQLWRSIETSISKILHVSSNRISTDQIDASSQIISILSASTLLSSVIHAIISTQHRIHKSDEHIENIIKKEMQVILYHIQILKQDLIQSTIRAESAQEAIIHHTDILIDSLVAYSLSPSNVPIQVHPYKVLSTSLSSSSFHNRHSQPIASSYSQEEADEISSRDLSFQHLTKRERPSTDTVSKKFMRGIHSLKSRPMTLLPQRHSIEPTNSEQSPKKKRIFYDRINEEEYNSDSWDDTSSNHSNKTGTIRSILRATNSKKSKGIRELFQSDLHSKKKRESISTLFNHNRKQSITKDEQMQGSFHSSSSTSSIESHTMDARPHLIPPFAKNTNIQWEEENWTAADLSREKSRKRRSNGSLVPLPKAALLSSTPMTRNNSPLPPLPTVENFLTIMNAPTSPDSSYFSARSSSQSTINSILLDDVTDSLASTHLMESSSSSDSSVSDTKLPPIPPPKDHRMMDLQDNLMTNIINNKQDKTINSKHITISTEMRMTTSDISNGHTFFSPTPPKSADAFRPPIPPRRSSMPLPPPPPKQNNAAVPPMPLDAKKRADAYSRRPSKTLLDESSWSSFLGIKKEDSNDRSKLGRSLGASAKKSKKSDTNNNLLKVTENGQVVLLYEMITGKLQVIAGTTDRLFEKLADEAAQDMDYVDTYIMNYSSFTTSVNLLNQLISRFHLGPLPGEYEYFKKWQYSIQTKVLNVIDRWITLQYQDFHSDLDLQKKLNLFLYNNDTVLLQQFRQQVEEIQANLTTQIAQFSNHQHHITSNSNVAPAPSTFNFHLPFVNTIPPVHLANSPRRPSNGLFNLSSYTPPESPVVHYSNTIGTTLHTSIVSLESRDIARYLTLADFYLFKSIQSRGLNHSHCKETIELMTKRANMLSHWVVHELSSLTYLKPKRSLLKKFIEIAKICLDLNNYHTCMVIVMGLASAPKLKDVWDTLSNRDSSTFASLQKLLDVSMNMRYYRQKIQLAKAPSIPFLPVVLKDHTFFRENSTFLVSHPHLINFSKFTSIRQFVDKTKALTHEHYYFSNDLTRYPFFPDHQSSSSSGALDGIADWIEDRLNQVEECYLHCDLL